MPDVAEKWVMLTTRSGELVCRTQSGMGVMDVRASLSSVPFVFTAIEPCSVTAVRTKDGGMSIVLNPLYSSAEDDTYFITDPILRFCGLRDDSPFIKEALSLREEVRAKRSGIVVPSGAGKILGIDGKPR